MPTIQTVTPEIMYALRQEAIRRGYQFVETELADGTQQVQMIRPDGTVAVTARKKQEPQ